MKTLALLLILTLGAPATINASFGMLGGWGLPFTFHYVTVDVTVGGKRFTVIMPHLIQDEWVWK